MLDSSFELLEILSTNGFKVQSMKKNPGLSIPVVRPHRHMHLINLVTGKFEPVEAPKRCEGMTS